MGLVRESGPAQNVGTPRAAATGPQPRVVDPSAHYIQPARRLLRRLCVEPDRDRRLTPFPHLFGPRSKLELPAAVRPALTFAAANALVAAPAFAEAGKIFDFNLTLPVMAAQFLFLMVVMDNLVYKPVGKVLDERDADLRTKVEAVKDNSAQLAMFTVRHSTCPRAPFSSWRSWWRQHILLGVWWAWGTSHVIHGPRNSVVLTRLKARAVDTLRRLARLGRVCGRWSASDSATILYHSAQDEADGIIRAARNDVAAEIGKAKSAAEAESATKIGAAKASALGYERGRELCIQRASGADICVFYVRDRWIYSPREWCGASLRPMCPILQAKLDAELKSALAALDAQKKASLSTLDAEVRGNTPRVVGPGPGSRTVIMVSSPCASPHLLLAAPLQVAKLSESIVKKVLPAGM